MFLVRPIVNRIWKNLTWITARSYVSSKPPRVRKGPDRFEISLDVRSFTHHELKIKAQTDYVIIQGKQEREIDNGYVIRQFAHKFKLPKGCRPDNMMSTLSPEGILTVAAKREYCDDSLPCETLIPIKLSEGSPEEAVSRKTRPDWDPCVKYKKIKIKPRPPDNGTNPKESK